MIISINTVGSQRRRLPPRPVRIDRALRELVRAQMVHNGLVSGLPHIIL